MVADRLSWKQVLIMVLADLAQRVRVGVLVTLFSVQASGCLIIGAKDVSDASDYEARIEALEARVQALEQQPAVVPMMP